VVGHSQMPALRFGSGDSFFTMISCRRDLARQKHSVTKSLRAGCQLVRCREQAWRSDDAGTLSLQGGDSGVALALGSDYQLRRDNVPGPGESFRFLASGGRVPAFVSPAVAMPDHVALTAPVFSGGDFRISRQGPLFVSWAHRGQSQVIVDLAVADSFIACLFPAAQGQGVVPVELLSQLPVDAGSGAFSVGSLASTTFDVGESRSVSKLGIVSTLTHPRFSFASCRVQ
jgi:hypothetical protein